METKVMKCKYDLNLSLINQACNNFQLNFNPCGGAGQTGATVSKHDRDDQFDLIAKCFHG